MEGCLSIPGYLGGERPSIRVRSLTATAAKRGCASTTGDARIFQHEVDHLNGELYIDKLTGPENIWTEEEFREDARGTAQKT